ncbi:unnamed protein product [Spodoptera littoralis]|uniref:Metalloendopeptidase n=1 Tax=Spodoptera littoralis TaxID=7109 RepID=A0A9P0N3E0_SPOLI|nr:unnamed protein product [Spodoptera littoralis]CAH1641008.1 unnamed protein product [Spodoptera littoralis]
MLLGIYLLLSIQILIIKCSIHTGLDELVVRRVDPKLIEKKRENTREMCRIFNSETLRAMMPGEGLPFTHFDQNELTQKKNGNEKEKKKAEEKIHIRPRRKRDIKSINPALKPKDEERVEKIVDKIYDDLLEKGHNISYRRKELPTVDDKGKPMATNKTGRRFPFAPFIMEGPTTDNIQKNTSFVDTRPPRFHHGIIPYFIDSKTYDAQLSEKILEAFDYFEKATCVRLQRLRERPTDQQSLQNVIWLYITNPSGIRQCVHSNEKAEIKGVQMIVFGYDCMSVGDISHEIMHILGFSHEHTRPDRDQYITILWDHVKEGYKKFFEIQHSHTHLDNLPYDYASVLHYPARAFSRNGQVTILAEPNIKIGQREGLSELDVEKVSMLYANECVKRNREYLVKTCPSVVRTQQVAQTPVTQDEIEDYFEDRVWPYGIINYQFRDRLEFSAEELENINAVIRHIEKETCIEFRDLSGMIRDAEDESSDTTPEEGDDGKEDTVVDSDDQTVTENDTDNGGGLDSGNGNKDNTNDMDDVEAGNEIPNFLDIEDGDAPYRNINNMNAADREKVMLNDMNVKEGDSKEFKGPIIENFLDILDGDDSRAMRDSLTTTATTNKKKCVKSRDRKNKNIPRNNLDNTMMKQQKNFKAGKSSYVGSKLKEIMLDEAKASNISATQKNSTTRKKRAIQLSPARRHATFFVQFTRSPLPGCQCPHPGKPEGKYVVAINSDCFNSVNDLLHLFVHILGLDHQHNMYDRDNYLHILWDELTEDIKQEMKTKLKPAASVGFPYDYQSVMHYPWLQIKDGKTNIMYPIWNDGWAMGNWQGLSSADVQKLNLLYFKQCVDRRQHAEKIELLRQKKKNK